MKKLGKVVLGTLFVSVVILLIITIIIASESILEQIGGKDPPNISTLLAEITIGIIISGLVYSLSTQQSEKIKKQQTKIENLITKIDEMQTELHTIIGEQNKFHKARERLGYLQLNSQIVFLKMSLFERKKLETAIAENKPSDQAQIYIDQRTSKTIDEIHDLIKDYSDVILADYLPKINYILTLAKICNENRRWDEHNHLLFDEMRKEINEIVEKLNSVHHFEVVVPYTKDPDWK